MVRIEIGCGNRPTEGYWHQDVIQLETPLDFCCNAWQLPVYENSVDEFIAIAVMEHLRYDDFRKTLEHFYRSLVPGGVFYFDVPDLYVWSDYLYNNLRGKETPFTRKHIIDTMWGWQRWHGDEHKSMWTESMVYDECRQTGFTVYNGLEDIKERVYRDRFTRPENAHIYIKAVK